MQPKAQSRIRIILAFVLFAGLVIIGRLYWLQVVENGYYKERANEQYVSPQGGLFDRGTIYFTTKDGIRVAAATVQQGFSLAIDPKKLIDPVGTFKKINAVTPVDQAKFMASAGKVSDPYEEISTELDADDGEKISALDIPGVIVTKDAWRYYSTGALGAQTVGIIGYATSSQLTGQYGLEKYYDSTLTRNDDDANINFFAELFSDIKSTVLNGQNLEGDVVTSIEPSVEAYLDQVLSTTKKQWQSDQIGGIIIDPKTGAIYAMDSLPSYDPNDRASVTNVSLFANPLVQNVYEMGSIMKPMTMSAAIDSKAVTPATTYNDTGCIVIDTKRICNYDLKARGVIPMQQILSQSLNVGASFLAMTMGTSTMQKYFLSYGLGSTTGIDQPSEQAGLVRNIEGGRDVNYATAAFGQGIAITPIETVRALSSIANGGYLVTPHLASEIDYDIGGKKTIDPPPGTRVFSTTTSATVTNMLINVVDQVMAPARADMSKPGYSIAAKTGTAQIADPVNGGYYPDRYLHSFFGYFPAHNPRFLVFLYQVYPKNVEYASETLTDPFAQIASYLISYYDIPPDR
ncbi:MAG: penicillin-binding protein 2 [Candidatus Pacebacteria bacterium]|nr:penicillin-binding protein 2 [Candidatus Paceibacterota bacterium]